MTPLHPIADKREARDMQAALDMVTIRSRLSLATEIVRLRQALATAEQRRISEGEVERLREHIAEQITHAETRIQDGKEMGASIWRIALEDIIRENREALISSPVAPDGEGDGPAIWRCAVADTIGCIDVALTRPLKASRRKAERELGARLHHLLQAIFDASRRHSPATYKAAFETGKEMIATHTGITPEEIG